MQSASIPDNNPAAELKSLNAAAAGETAARQAAEKAEAKTKLLASLSTEELMTSRVSERLGRLFSAATEYANKATLTAALDEAEKVFPLTKLAYKPSGKTTPQAIVIMLLAAPILLVLMTAIAFGLCWVCSALPHTFTNSNDPSYMEKSTMGKLGLLVDLILVIGMTVVPLMSYGFLSKLTKNRNPLIPAILTGVVNIILAVLFFVPIWHGETLAPTHISFFFVPVRWVLILIGGALAPIISLIAVHHTVSTQRFCEVSGRYLKKFRQARLSLDYAENALALLQRGEYVRSAQLPPATPEQVNAKHIAEISLWWHEQARIAFLELEIQFHGRLAPPKTGKREEFKKEKKWIAYSTELHSGHAEVLAREMAASS